MKSKKSILVLSAITLISLIVLPSLSNQNVLPSWAKPTLNVINPRSLVKPFSEKQCLMCKFSVNLINYALKTRKGSDFVYKLTNNFCTYKRIENPLVCSRVTKLFNKEVVKVLSNGVVTPDQMCGALSNNTCGVAKNPLADWEVHLEASQHINQEELAKIRQQHQQQELSQSGADSNKPFKIIHLSDTHVDLKYQEGAPAQCQEPLCCQNGSTPTNEASGNSNNLKAGYWGSQSNCDVPLRTFVSALDFIAKIIANSPPGEIQHIIWTGDIQPHDIWQQNKKSAISTYDSVFKEIFKRLPNVKIYPTLGNHEMVPVDSFSPSNMLSIAREDSPEWLYRKIDSYWSRWLPNDTVATITKDGFYSTSLRPGLKIISLNTNFCHKTNLWLYIDSTDPGNQLQWLIHELQISELLHEQVYLIGHIPPGAGDCLKVWSKNFNRIVRRFSNTISGQFFGHTHQDEFEVFYQRGEDEATNHQQHQQQHSHTLNGLEPEGVHPGDQVHSGAATNLKPISVGFIGPSITTFVGQNPSFRVYTIDPGHAFVPVDFETYSMDLMDANLRGEQAEPHWISTGSFANLFGLPDTSVQSMHRLLVDLAGEFTSQTIASHSAQTTAESPLGAPAYKNLLKLYMHTYAYGESFNSTTFAAMPLVEKKNFLCKFFTSQSQNHEACDEFIISHL